VLLSLFIVDFSCRLYLSCLHLKATPRIVHFCSPSAASYHVSCLQAVHEEGWGWWAPVIWRPIRPSNCSFQEYGEVDHWGDMHNPRWPLGRLFRSPKATELRIRLGFHLSVSANHISEPHSGALCSVLGKIIWGSIILLDTSILELLSLYTMVSSVLLYAVI
jgi:hypothetical protein